ncbi:deoC [Symbiodinium microadriaticum]|nr:deoC [Symbiodinium microadriaticum]
MEHCSSTSPERALLDILDFTLLDHNATISDLDDFARKAAAAQPAAVCVYTEHIHHMKMRLSNSGILLAAVAGGFPVGDNSVETLSNAVREAVSAGADEIDFVLEPGHSEAFPGPHEESLLRAAREASQDCTLKVILETSLLSEAAMVSVADLALQCGADFLKTSTGKRGGASALSARLLVAAIRRYEERTGIKRGIKLSGGIRTAQDADDLLAGVRSGGQY